MAVHRISDRAEAVLQELAKAEGKKPSEFLHWLILAYKQGLSFEGESK